MRYIILNCILTLVLSSIIQLNDGSKLEWQLSIFQNLTFQGLYEYPGQYLTFYFPDLLKKVNSDWFTQNIKATILCLNGNTPQFSSELRDAKINITFSSDGANFLTQFYDLDDCLNSIKFENFTIDNRYIALSFSSIFNQKLEYYRAIFKQTLKTDTRGCAWMEIETSSNFEICDYDCLQNKSVPKSNPASTLKFCKDQTCQEVFEEVEVFNGEELFLLQEVQYDAFKETKFEYGNIFYISEDGFSESANFKSALNYQQGKIIYHLQVNHAWVNFQLSSISQINYKEKRFKIGGNTKSINCVLDSNSKCLSCQQICNLNCGAAPVPCKCKKHLCLISSYSPLNLFLALIMILVII